MILKHLFETKEFRKRLLQLQQELIEKLPDEFNVELNNSVPHDVALLISGGWIDKLCSQPIIVRFDSPTSISVTRRMKSRLECEFNYPEHLDNAVRAITERGYLDFWKQIQT